MSYTVGQVLFVILKKEASVYPMQVVEEITKKTLDGEVTTYMVRAGSDPQKVLAITDVDGEVFDSSEKARGVLIERVSSTISQRVDAAVAKAKEWYPSGFEKADDDPLSVIKKKTSLPTMAPPRKSMPAAPVKGRMKSETQQLAAELAQEAEDATVMQIPDGNGGVTLAKVRGVKLPPTLS